MSRETVDGITRGISEEVRPYHPARTLASVTAQRAIIETCLGAPYAIGLVLAAHPDYRPEWAL